MTKAEIKTNLETILTDNGFGFQYDKYSWMPNMTKTMDDYASIIFLTDMKLDIKNHKIIERVKCVASVCKMNPNADVAELMNASDMIARAANVMAQVNSMSMETEVEL